jgi:predicted regulator of Ras-like GTPase activity (Roadblock/LC7/MglB family)
MPQKSDAELRKDRLRFYREEMTEINQTLRNFLTRAKANAAFLVDKDGHLITKEGTDERVDVDAICGLVAGAFAATKQMALILGEETFLNLFHQGKRVNIQVTLVGNRTILAVVFDENTTIGMVRLYLAEAAATLTTIFERILQRTEAAAAAGG